MTALAEALVAAQRRALTAMEKAYVAGKMPSNKAADLMAAIGAVDTVDQERLLRALDVIREYGAQLPAEPAANNHEPKTPERATEAQLNFIAKLVKEQNVTGPEVPLTKEQAGEVIQSLKAGTYDPNKWTVPF